MKAFVLQPLQAALENLRREGIIPEIPENLELDRPKQQEHGDLASNIALLLAKKAGRKPRDLAAAIIAALPASDWIVRTEIAGPGFINFFLAPAAFHGVIAKIQAEKNQFGANQQGGQQKLQLEFVSANPTGPLHVGHGRGAAYGASLANILRFNGYDVFCEYYVNDAGRQMDILAASVFMRYLEAAGLLPWAFPDNSYRGDYVREIAAELRTQVGEALQHARSEMPDLPAMEDPDAAIDALIAHLKERLGKDDYQILHSAGLDSILSDIRADLEQFGVHYQNWYSERQLVDSGAVDRAVAALESAGHCYLQEGALWFKSTAFGDDKDRVIRRENGAYTYFASDIAYHAEKFARGFTRVIDMWGADHHGYVPRVRAALQALGLNDDQLEVVLVQFAILYRGTEKVSMSTRAGEFVTLRELREEVGNDAARFFYVLRRADQHLDFDLDLAKKHSEENPVFYIQYAHARVYSMLRQAAEKGLSLPADHEADLECLQDPRELALTDVLWRFPEVVQSAARDREPHQIAFYLRDLAASFHTYYNSTRILVEETPLRHARLILCKGVAQTIANGLRLLGVAAPEQM
ncbi:arginine--tRNA ligase [Acidithiobacillus marinus]|uniref:Arginine--tRNA ligase n=1 Tax=Acidithiobacillus marinus TaxID=187490 RepID=A0A2I1DPR8_9PROT|nr:arginine--tRNA ligase [Acidithiobacillus marinus]PKY11885.1 arginine--tRNA ligase [Acidithiobacillus marinus]